MGRSRTVPPDENGNGTNGTTSMVIHKPEVGGEMSVYDAVARDPGGVMAAVEKMGAWFHASGMFGVKTPSAGCVLALATVVKRQDVFEIMNDHMIVEGILTKKYEVMLVNLRAMGGDYDWIEDGEDGKQATIEITWRGKTKRFTYTMDMARRAELVKPGSGWVKRPGNMLRSKAVRNGFGMYCPEVSRGVMTPEDAYEVADEQASRGKQTITVEQIEASRAELQRLAAEGDGAGDEVGEVVDAEFTVTPDVETESTFNPAKLMAEAIRVGIDAGIQKAAASESGPSLFDGMTFPDATPAPAVSTQAATAPAAAVDNVVPFDVTPAPGETGAVEPEETQAAQQVATPTATVATETPAVSTQAPTAADDSGVRMISEDQLELLANFAGRLNLSVQQVVDGVKQKYGGRHITALTEVEGNVLIRNFESMIEKKSGGKKAS